MAVAIVARVAVDETERILGLLRGGGGRMSHARRLIVEMIVQSKEHHFTGPQVIEAVRKRNPGFPESTVYRTLDRLTELGVLTALPLTPGATTFHLAKLPHHHLVCHMCGAVAEVDADLLDDVATRLAGDDFSLDRGSAVTLHGWCARCQSKRRSRRSTA